MNTCLEISLDGLSQCALIIPNSVGVLYRQQAGGTACIQKKINGLLVPINHDYPLSQPSASLEAKVMALFSDGAGVITDSKADEIDGLLGRSPFTSGIRVDRQRLEISTEAWVYVTICSGDNCYLPIMGGSDLSAILTWPNSD